MADLDAGFEAADDVSLARPGAADDRMRDVLEQIEKTHEVASEVDPDAGLWVTEIGWGSDPSSGNDLAKTPEEQAELLDETYTAMLDGREETGLEGVVWFTWRDVDIGVECAWCSSAGLVDGDRDGKPAWEAFTDITGGDPGE